MAQQQLANAITLRPVESGEGCRITFPPAHGLVRPELAEALETAFERFARERGFIPEKPLGIHLTRGFKAGSHGHGEGSRRRYRRRRRREPAGGETGMGPGDDSQR